jgi:hypothetical protein
MVFFALFMVVAEGLIVSEIEIRSVPNQGIRQSARNAAIIGLFCGAIGGMIAWLAWGLDAGVAAGSSAGLIACVLGGGWACIQHFALRMICSQNDYAPWNYARFLDYATERIFLRKVGGGYIFIHRLLQDYFASLSQGQ